MGTSKMSSNIESVFKSIQEQLEVIFSINKEDIEYKNKQEFKDKLSFISEKYLKRNKLLILLDSIDQLREQDYYLEWLFNILPKNIKIIYSVLKDYKNIFQKLKKYKIKKIENIFELDALNIYEAKKMLDSYLKSSHRQLSALQTEVMNKLFDKLENICPLQVKLIFDVVSKWKSSFIPNDDFLKCKTSIEIIKYNFKIIEQEIFDNEIFFKHCLFYLNLFEYKGIGENELEDLLSIDDDVLQEIFKHHHPPLRRFPMAMWFRLKYELKDYITSKMIDETSVVAWYHRAFIEASNEYLKDYLDNTNNSSRFIKRDDLLVNLIDYFSEKWNERRSDGTLGEKKSFIYHSDKPKRIKFMKSQFEYSEIGENYIKCKSYRETASQTLKSRGKINKRKLNELIPVIEKINSKELSYQIMKECLYNTTNEKNFFYILQEHLKKDGIFTSNKKLNLLLPAAYFGHSEIIKWLLVNHANDINISNDECIKRYPIHLGKKFEWNSTLKFYTHKNRI
jgi:hypothetical protein